MENLFTGLLTINANLAIRTILGVAMLSCFLKVCGMDKTWLAFISLFISLGISIEMISITKKRGEAFPLNPLLIGVMYATIFAFNTAPALVTFYGERKSLNRLMAVRPLLFALYSVGLIFSILSLSRETLVSQLILLTMTHIAAFVCSAASAHSIRNIMYGKFFYAYPALLVIANDAFAYFVGKAVGRTPLISLSPNKTVEGFIGGFVFTLLVGLGLSYLKINGLFLSDKFDHRLNESINPKKWYLSFPCVYLHNLIFVLAASFFAPFCGFLASAIKRAFDRKDFGSLIPGHGGITDRFDCQLLMVFFTHYYIKGVMDLDCSFVNIAYNFFISNMREPEIQQLLKMLSVHGRAAPY